MTAKARNAPQGLTLPQAPGQYSQQNEAMFRLAVTQLSATFVRKGDGTYAGSATGVPAGGTSGQVLKKLSGADYDTGWLTLAAVATSGSAADLTGTLHAAQLPAFTGDATSSAGSSALTLATVNSNVGSFGDAAHSLALTVNGKGLVTAAASNLIAIAWSQITSGKPTTLSGYGITDAQPLDSDLTAIAALTTTTYGRGLLTSASATALMNSLSASDLTTGTLPAGRLPALTGDVTTSAGSAATTLATTQTGAHTWSALQSFTANALIGSGTATGTQQITLQSAAGNTRQLLFKTAGNSRWTLGVTSTAEGGSNAGSDFFVGAYDDTGVFLGFALTGTRSTRALNFTVAPTFTDASTTRTNLGLGTLATQSGTFSGTSSGTNTGDETTATIKTKLGITTLSGSNTGDQTFSLTVPSIFTSGGSSTSALSFTLATETANLVFAGPTTGSAAAPTFRALVAADIPSLSSTYLPIASQAADSAKLGGVAAASYATTAAVAAGYQPLAANLTSLASLAYTSGTYVVTLTASGTINKLTVGASTGNILDKASGDSLYLGLTATAADSSKLGGTVAASYALLASPAFTGTPTVPTATAGTNTTQAASTAFTTGAIATAQALDEKLANKDTSGGYPSFSSGTWTPTVSFGTPGTSSFTYSSQFGQYVQIGNLVYIDFFLTFTPTIGTATGTLRIGGLPFNLGADMDSVGTVRSMTATFTWPAGCTQAVLATTAAGAALQIACAGSAATPGGIGATNMTSGSVHTIGGTMVYRK